MARIKDDDIALVRERVRIDEVVEPYVTLRNAGGGARKGLCPFHDEKTPSFNVRPAQGFYHCFGCGAGGDAIKFLMEIEGLTFAEAVERLAGKYGIQLHYEESSGGFSGPRRDPGQRHRLLEAHRLAQEFYAQNLTSSPEAQVGRSFVTDRGFDQTAAEHFDMGWAPRSGRALAEFLGSKGYTEDELVTGGLVRRSARGAFDVFQGRLLWPIKEISGEVIGFGARKLFDDDFMAGKYVNTAETPLYKKTQVLYGIHLARRQISGSNQAVIVEGYTDVMACHLAGVTTAVATCGTAFGEGHARVLRRLMLDHDAFHGEVIFTFDGDEAGQRAALKAYEGDQDFVGQTYVAVESRGLDPCDLRLADGDEAVRELIASRVPLYRFVLDNTLLRFDLDRSDQRVDAVREAVKLGRSIRDQLKIQEFLREIARRIGVDIDQVQREFARANSSGQPQAKGPAAQATTPAPVVSAPVSDFGRPEFYDEREALKAIAQYPQFVHPHEHELSEADFTHPIAQALWRAIEVHGLPEDPDPGWLPRLSDQIDDDVLRRVLRVAAVEPMRVGAATAPVVNAVIAQLREKSVRRRISDVRSRLQRTDPVAQPDAYNVAFAELMELEQHRKQLYAQKLPGDA